VTFRIVEDDPASPALAALITLHVTQAHANTPREHSHALDAAGLAAGSIVFWTARDGDAVAGMIALKPLGGDHGEIKSMRTAPGYLRRGVARALLDHALGVARSRGYARVSLETGTHPDYAPANALYEGAGFVDGPVFGGYPDSPHNRFMTLPLQG
jgi:putative acetyltransferase